MRFSPLSKGKSLGNRQYLLLPVEAVLPYVGQVGYESTEGGTGKQRVEIGIGQLEFIQRVLLLCCFGFAADPAEVQIIQMNFAILAVEGEQESRWYHGNCASGACVISSHVQELAKRHI